MKTSDPLHRIGPLVIHAAYPTLSRDSCSARHRLRQTQPTSRVVFCHCRAVATLSYMSGTHEEARGTEGARRANSRRQQTDTRCHDGERRLLPSRSP